MANDNRYYAVDGWITASGTPRIQLEEPVTGRKRVLTLPEIRTLIADIHAEIQRLDEERKGETYSGNCDTDN